MYRTGHYGAALLAYAPVALVLRATGADGLLLPAGIAALALAKLPDVDRHLPVPHRGPTHTAWFALAVGAGLGLLGALAGWPRGAAAALGTGAVGFAVGTLTVGSHVAADALTPMGVRPFAPRQDTEYALGIARSANAAANLGLLALGIAAIGAALWLGTRLRTLPQAVLP